MPFKTLVWSLADTQKRHIDLYLMHISLNDSDIENLSRFCEALEVSLHPIKVDDSLYSKLKELRGGPDRVTSSGFPFLEVYLRLFAPGYLPSDLHKCLYLDADIIVQKDLISFYDFNMGDCLLSAVIDPVMYNDSLVSLKETFFRKCGLEEEFNYVNAGVMMMNLDAIRKSDLFKEEILFDYMESHMEYNDQDMVNTLLYSKVIVFSNILYNLPPFVDLERINNAKIMHYMSGKPWNVLNDTIPLQAAEKWNRCKKWVDRIDRMLGIRVIE